MESVQRVRKGDVRAIAKMMSLAETGTERAREALGEIYRHTGRAHVVGLTGVPGSGKSTLVGALTGAIRETGRTVGIVAIDPSSPYSGGAILGDRIRMAGLTGDDGVFIRSMASRGALGGLAGASLDTVDILDAAGFDMILVETVGVGQDEVDIVQAAHTVVVVSAPGLGDDIQAIKAGVLEIADIHAVSKCDRADAAQTVSELNGMLTLGRPLKEGARWKPPVLPTSAETGEGIGDLLSCIDSHRRYLDESGELETRKTAMLKMRILKSAEDVLRRRLRRGGAELEELIGKIRTRALSPHGAARVLLASVFGKSPPD